MKPTTRNCTMHKHGFTLIELSIVIVIIALLVGGIVAGKEIIATAQIRAGISQIDKYKAAYQTFELKYGCVPGDCVNAPDYGFTDVYGFGVAYSRGDGDGLIYSYDDGSTNATTTMSKRFESWLSIKHLYEAKLVAENGKNNNPGVSNFPVQNSFMIFSSMQATTPHASAILPPKVGNYLYAGFQYPTGTAPSFVVMRPVLQPNQAYQIDNKIDDGLPMLGDVRATWTNYSCAGTYSTAGYGPCFNTPMRRASSWPDWTSSVNYTVDDTVSPALYRTQHFACRPGYDVYCSTSITVLVD